jgi:hypothetical protein
MLRKIPEEGGSNREGCGRRFVYDKFGCDSLPLPWKCSMQIGKLNKMVDNPKFASSGFSE